MGMRLLLKTREMMTITIVISGPDDGKSDTVTISDDNNYSLDGGIYSPTYCLGDMIWKDIDQGGGSQGLIGKGGEVWPNLLNFQPF